MIETSLILYCIFIYLFIYFPFTDVGFGAYGLTRNSVSASHHWAAEWSKAQKKKKNQLGFPLHTALSS